MKVIRYPELPSDVDCVATIGNFDGMHIGLEAILQQLVQQSKNLSLPSCVILFEPQPLEYFLAENAPARLSRLREKLSFLQSANIERVVVLPFNETLANVSPEEFVEKLLLEKLRVKHLIIGDDFRFGKNRRGDFAFLKKYLSVDSAKTVSYEGERASSTRIRVALAKGDLDLAKHLLGHSYSMMGRVSQGDKRGRSIGFPTANIYLHRRVIPLKGVFAVKIYRADGSSYEGVANLGTRPTVGGQRTLLEVHLFNFNEDIYNEYIKIEFWQKLRDEKHFDSLNLLKQQIAQDVEEAKTYFSNVVPLL